VAKVLADAFVVDLSQSRDLVVGSAYLLRHLRRVVDFVRDAVVADGDSRRRVFDDRRGRGARD